MKDSPLINELLTFLDTSPTAWHAVENISTQLKEKGFTELQEGEPWNLQKGHGYYIRRYASICAFITPQEKACRVRLIASHTDSPGFKLKPNPEIRKNGSLLLAFEVYGAPLMTSWFNRDLGLAGMVTYLNKKGQVKSKLVTLDRYPLVIPQLAIHLDREVNEKGLLVNKQDHLNALVGLEKHLPSSKSYLETLLGELIEFKKILHFDLFLYPLTPARLVGYQDSFIASYRIDSLASVHAALAAFLDGSPPLREEIKMVTFWDHEEIGSQSEQGAGSVWFSHTLERLSLALNLSREDYLSLVSQSHCISVDLAHALHPNYVDKHDPNHQPRLSEGVVLKSNAQQRYATNVHSATRLCLLADQLKMPLQKFVSRNDMPCGTTIGPIHAAATGMSTVDIGCGQLSMHSARELMSTEDHISMYTLLKGIFS